MLRDLKLAVLLRLFEARRWLLARLLGHRFEETVALPLRSMIAIRTHEHHEAWLTRDEAARLARKLYLLSGGDPPAPAPSGPCDGPLPVNRVAAYAAARMTHPN